MKLLCLLLIMTILIGRLFMPKFKDSLHPLQLLRNIIGLLIFIIMISGCSAPNYFLQDNINCYYRHEGKGWDFKNNTLDLDEEKYITNLKSKIKNYISTKLAIDGGIKTALESFKVIKGMSKEEVRLLLGNPERTQVLNPKNKFKADERWVYIMKGLQYVYIGPVPVFFTHDAYHLYFSGEVLIAIEAVAMEYL